MQVMEVWSKTQASAESLAARVGCNASWGQVERATQDAEMYIISVKDTALPEVIRHLHEGRENALFAHTAGSLPLSLFRDAGHERGAVFYPLQTFSKERAVDFGAVHFFLETSREEDFEQLKSLAERLTTPAKIHHSTSATRRWLHLAAVFACNFGNHCCTVADDLLAEAGVDFRVLLPLMDEMVAKLHQLPPREAQTGPAARRDENVMGMQRAMLTDRPDLQQLYTLLSNSIQQYDQL